MFRSILRPFVLRYSNVKLSRMHLYSASEFQLPRPSEINDVKLRGSVFRTAFVNSNGSLRFYLKTVDPNKTNYNIHCVRIENPQLKNIVADHMQVDQYIYVSGKINSYPFSTEDSKVRTMLEIKANQLYRLLNTEHKSSSLDDTDNSVEDAKNNVINAYTSHFNDKNHVEILAHISSEIEIGDRFINFSLTTHHPIKNYSNEIIEKTEFHSVFVFDNALQEYVRDQLNKGDRVIVEGGLDYKDLLNKEGQTIKSGYVKASNILKVSKFKRKSNENFVLEND